MKWKFGMMKNTETTDDSIGLTEADKTRIQRYLRKPSYERTEEDLRPSDDT